MVTLTPSRDPEPVGHGRTGPGESGIGSGHRRGKRILPARALAPPCSMVRSASGSPGRPAGVDRSGLTPPRPGGEPDDDLFCHDPMTAGLSTRGHDARIRHQLTPSRPSGPPSSYHSHTALPAAGFTVPATGIRSLVPAGPDQPISPPEGETDSPHDDRHTGRRRGRWRRPGPRRTARADPPARAQVLPRPAGAPGVAHGLRGRRRPGRLHGGRQRAAELPAQGPVVPRVRLRHRRAQGHRRLPGDRAQPRRAGGGPAGRPGHRGRPRAPPARRRDVRPAGQAPRAPDPASARGAGAAAGGRAVGGGDGAGGPVDARRRSGHPAPRAGPAAQDPAGRVGGPRARGRRAAAGRPRRGGGDPVDGSADDLVDPVPDEPGFHELDIDPDVAAADDSAIDAMAALFVGPDPEPVVAIPAPRRPTPYKRT